MLKSKLVLESYIQNRHIDGSLLRRIENLSREESDIVKLIIDSLSPSANTLRVFLSLADEISARDSLSLSEVFRAVQFEVICSNEKLSRKEKQKQLRILLENLRFPEITKVKGIIKSATDSVTKETGFLLALPDNLEGDVVKIEISFCSVHDLREIETKIGKLRESKSLQIIFDALSGRY